MANVFGSSAFKNLKLEDALFSKLRIDYSPPSQLTHLVVANSHLVLATLNKFLIKIDLLNPNEKEEIDLSKFIGTCKIFKIFLDPTGNHILFSLSTKDNLNPGDLIYLHWSSNKPKPCTRFKGNLVTSVGWNNNNHSETVTGPILIGTSKGLIYETELVSDERLFQGGIERSFKELYSFDKDEMNNCIEKLEIFTSPVNDLLFLIFCSLPNTVVQFVGNIRSLDERPFFENLFKNCSTLCSMSEKSLWKRSFFASYHTQNTNIVQKYICLSCQDMHVGEIKWMDSMHVDSHSASHAYSFAEICEDNGKPCGLVATQFHLLVAWPQKVVGICTLNGQKVFEDNISEEYGHIVGISKDFVKSTVWAFTERCIFKYKIDRESKNIWQIYTEKGNFEMAKKYCDRNEDALLTVLQREAEHLFDKGQYVNSASIYSNLPLSFEEVCLKFVEEDADEGLKLFLRNKLEEQKSNETTQITLLVMWLFELYLKKLGELRDNERRNCEEYLTLDKEFKNEFLRNPKVRNCITQNSNAVYGLLASHDDQDNYVGLAIIMKDFSRVVLHLIEHKRSIEALEVMATQSSAKLFYEHTSSLLQVIPKETIKALIEQGQRLDPVMLLPTLAHAHASYGHTSEVMQYLEFCIDKLDIQEKALHNFLITLYCAHSSDKLLAYLKLQGDDAAYVSYDVKFALRECMTAGLDSACVHLLTVMGLYQEAVELALKSDISLAKAIANRTKHDSELCKKLWLMIAAHVVQQEQNISRAIEVLRECSLLKIEDILPFFPDFVTIDQFKDAICNSLQEYNEQIDNLKKEMDDASISADQIRDDIKKFKQKSSVIRAHDKCCECRFPLFSNSFYIFPCSHMFHQDCLSDAVLTYLPDNMQKRLSELKGKLISLATSDDYTQFKGAWNEREQIRLKIDSIVAAECIYCGETAVNNVDKPFIQDHEWESVMSEWH